MTLPTHNRAPAVPLPLASHVKHLGMQALHLQALSWPVASIRRSLQQWCVTAAEIAALMQRLILLHLCPYCIGMCPASANQA
jgi:hypothetical protein